MNEIIAIIHCHNVEDRLEELITKLHNEHIDALLVEDGSTDHTLTVIRLLHQCKQMRYIALKKRYGRDTAIRAGLEAVVDLGYKYVAVMGADLSDVPAFITYMEECIRKQNLDCVSMRAERFKISREQNFMLVKAELIPEMLEHEPARFSTVCKKSLHKVKWLHWNYGLHGLLGELSETVFNLRRYVRLNPDFFSDLVALITLYTIVTITTLVSLATPCAIVVIITFFSVVSACILFSFEFSMDLDYSYKVKERGAL